MGTPESPEYCAVPGCHVRSPSTCLGMDAWGRAARLCKEELGHGPRQTCRQFLPSSAQYLTPLQSLGIAEGLAYLHSCGLIHGDLKGVRAVVDSGTPRLTEIIAVEYNGRRIRKRTDHGLWSSSDRSRPQLAREPNRRSGPHSPVDCT